MQDEKIVSLYWAREEQAITETQKQYGNYCFCIAQNILRDERDAQEIVNDTWQKAWQAIPPERPRLLSAFLGKITRNLSLNRFKALGTQKRGGGEMTLVFEELDACIPTSENTEQAVEQKVILKCINAFLWGLPERDCNLFLARYWYALSLKEMSAKFSISENHLKTILFRLRAKLKNHLEREGALL